MLRVLITTFILAALAPKANAFGLFELVFHEQAQVSVANNGGIWLSARWDVEGCKFKLVRGKEKIRLEIVETTDSDREFSHPNLLLRPSSALGTGAPYLLRYRCPRTPWMTIDLGEQDVAFHGTGEADHSAPRWDAQPRNIEQAPLCPACGQSTMEFAARFTLPVRDDSPMRIHATFWRSDNSEPAFTVPKISDEFYIEKWSNDVEWKLVPGVCYQVSFCATDFAGNTSCTNPQPFVRMLASCWADREVEFDSLMVRDQDRVAWCQTPPESQMHRAPASVEEKEPGYLRLHLLGIAALLLLLLHRLRRARLLKSRLGHL